MRDFVDFVKSRANERKSSLLELLQRVQPRFNKVNFV